MRSVPFTNANFPPANELSSSVAVNVLYDLIDTTAVITGCPSRLVSVKIYYAGNCTLEFAAWTKNPGNGYIYTRRYKTGVFRLPIKPWLEPGLVEVNISSSLCEQIIVPDQNFTLGYSVVSLPDSGTPCRVHRRPRLQEDNLTSHINRLHGRWKVGEVHNFSDPTTEVGVSFTFEGKLLKC